MENRDVSISNIWFDGTIAINRIEHPDNGKGLSLGKTGTKREINKVVNGLVGKSDTDYSDQITRLYFEKPESIDALITELTILKLEQFENYKIEWQEE